MCGSLQLEIDWRWGFGWQLDWFDVFALRFVGIGVEIGREEQNELVCGMAVGTRSDDLRSVELVKGKVSDENTTLFSCPYENSLYIESSSMLSFV